MDPLSSNLSCAFEDITPEVAREMLNNNPHNRTIALPAVNRLKNAIARGEWMSDSTDAIGIDSNGNVGNGQHRLAAIADGTKTVKMLVVRNMRPEAIKVIDTGRGRSTATYLGLTGAYEEPGTLAKGLEWQYKVRNGYERSIPYALKPTTPQLLELLGEHPNLALSIPLIKEICKSFKLDKGLLATYHYALVSIDPKLGEEFFDQLASGEYLQKGDPIYTLREKLVENCSQRDKEKQAKPYEIATWLVRAWNAKQAGKELTPKELTFFVRSGVKATPVPRLPNLSWMLRQGQDGEAMHTED